MAFDRKLGAELKVSVISTNDDRYKQWQFAASWFSVHIVRENKKRRYSNVRRSLAYVVGNVIFYKRHDTAVFKSHITLEYCG